LNGLIRAIALVFGELISTAIILLLLPAAYVAWEERRLPTATRPPDIRHRR